jgi:hypothetical protein
MKKHTWMTKAQKNCSISLLRSKHLRTRRKSHVTGTAHAT